MTTTVRQSKGSLSLAQTETAIRTFEAGFAKFQKNELVASPTTKLNRITFETLDLEQPKEFKLTLSTDATPNGFLKIWQGAMFVDGTNTNVIAWREG